MSNGVWGFPANDKKTTRGLAKIMQIKKGDLLIWKDTIYPYRVNFRKEILFHGKKIPCNAKDLGKSLHEILRKLQVNGTVEKIDSSLIVKLMSLCTKD